MNENRNPGGDDAGSIGWRRLICAVIIRAVKDSRGQGEHQAEARAFLEDAGPYLLLLLELDLDIERVL